MKLSNFAVLFSVPAWQQKWVVADGWPSSGSKWQQWTPQWPPRTKRVTKETTKQTEFNENICIPAEDESPALDSMERKIEENKSFILEQRKVCESYMKFHLHPVDATEISSVKNQAHAQQYFHIIEMADAECKSRVPSWAT